jgi:NitT/TauT family transport system permease protein
MSTDTTPTTTSSTTTKALTFPEEGVVRATGRKSFVAKTPAEKREAAWYTAGAVTVFGAVFLLWETLPALGLVNEIILPRATNVAAAIRELLVSDFLWENVRSTMAAILWGFVAGVTTGILIGIGLAVFRPFKRLFYPFVVAFQTIPKIVFAPLFIVWFGFGQNSKIAMATAIGFFPVLINTMVGLENVPQDAIRLMRSLRATPLQTFWKVRILHAAPLIFAGIKSALTYAVIGVIVAEFVGSRKGLGHLLTVYNFQLRIDRAFAIIVFLSIIGSALYFMIEWVDRRLIFWSEDRKAV